MTLAFDLKHWSRDWTAACGMEHLQRTRGVAVLLPDNSQVALFRLADDSLRAVGNIDPIGRAAVLSRGIVGDRNGFPVVHSPLTEQLLTRFWHGPQICARAAPGRSKITRATSTVATAKTRVAKRRKGTAVSPLLPQATLPAA